MSLILASPHPMSCLETTRARELVVSSMANEASTLPASPRPNHKAAIPAQYKSISNVSSTDLDDIAQGPVSFTFCDLDDLMARHIESSPAKGIRSINNHQSISSLEYSASQQQDEHSLLDANNLHNSSDLADWMETNVPRNNTRIGTYLKDVVLRRRGSTGTDFSMTPPSIKAVMADPMKLGDITYPKLSALERLKQQQAKAQPGDEHLLTIPESQQDDPEGGDDLPQDWAAKTQRGQEVGIKTSMAQQPMLVKGLLADKARLHMTIDSMRRDHGRKVADWEQKWNDQQNIIQEQEGQLRNAAEEQATLSEQLSDRDLTIQVLQSQLSQAKESQRQVEQRLEWILQDCEDDGYGDVDPSESVVEITRDDDENHPRMDDKADQDACPEAQEQDDEDAYATNSGDGSGGSKQHSHNSALQNLYARVQQLQVEKDASHDQVARLSHSLAESQHMIDHLKAQVDGYNQMISKIIGPAALLGENKNTNGHGNGTVTANSNADTHQTSTVTSILPRRFSLSDSNGNHHAPSENDRGMSLSTNNIHSARRGGMDGSRLGNLRARFWGSTQSIAEEEDAMAS